MTFRQTLRQRSRGAQPTLSRLILTRIAELGAAAIGSFFPARYPEARIWREALGLSPSYRFQRQTFSSLLSRLQAQGLVARSGTTRTGMWRLTTRGSAHLAESSSSVAMRPDGIRRLVIFDIPEQERRKRHAIRVDLTAAGFTPLQKSVWQGERPLPPGFLELIGVLGLKPYIHIFSVRDSGTLFTERVRKQNINIF